MELTDEQVKEAIADGRISAITLDTSIFEASQNGFEHGLLVRLKQFNGTPVGVVLSDVVLGEVKSHVTKAAADAQAKIRTGMKEVGGAWQVTREQREKAMEALFGAETPEQLAERRIKAFVESNEVVEVKSAGRVDIEAVLSGYFATKPPFGGSAVKKSEFPDAFALQALEHWAKEKNTLLLVVSGDKGWVEYCKPSPHLVATDDLAKALSYFHQNAEVACARLVDRFNAGQLDIEGRIEDAVQDAAYRLTLIPEASSSYRYEADVHEVEVKSIDIGAAGERPFTVVDKPDEDVLVVEADVEATLAVSASFQFFIIDPIDKDEVLIGYNSATEEITLDFKVLLTFDGDLAGNAELTDVEVETDKRSIDVDYGEVGPDFDEGPDVD